MYIVSLSKFFLRVVNYNIYVISLDPLISKVRGANLLRLYCIKIIHKQISTTETMRTII